MNWFKLLFQFLKLLIGYIEIKLFQMLLLVREVILAKLHQVNVKALMDIYGDMLNKGYIFKENIIYEALRSMS